MAQGLATGVGRAKSYPRGYILPLQRPEETRPLLRALSSPHTHVKDATYLSDGLLVRGASIAIQQQDYNSYQYSTRCENRDETSLLPCTTKQNFLRDGLYLHEREERAHLHPAPPALAEVFVGDALQVRA